MPLAQMPSGASKVVLACLCLRFLIKATEEQKTRAFAYQAQSSNTTRPQESYCLPSPVHTATCLALPFTSLGQKKDVINAEVPVPAASLRDPHHNVGGPVPLPQCPAWRWEHGGLCPEVRALALISHAAPAPPCIPLIRAQLGGG